MFGKENGKEIRLALEEAGCNMDDWKKWQRKYDRLLKNMPGVRERYGYAKTTTKEVERIAKSMESIIAEGKQAERGKEFGDLLKELKKCQNTFDHPFIINREDKEFHSTYDSILKLGVKALEDDSKRLILQSEIENLLALLTENLERTQPNLIAFGYYSISYGEDNLAELSPTVRLVRIEEIYENEFRRPFVQMVSEAMIFADPKKKVLENSMDRSARKKAEVLQILWEKADTDLTVVQRADDILIDLMKLEE